MTGDTVILLYAFIAVALLFGFVVIPFLYVRSRRQAQARLAAEQTMPQWLAERTDEQLPPVLVRTYWGEHQRDATQKYAEEANLLIPRGYSVVGQSWADTKTSAGDIVAYGVLGFGNKGGTLTVTYSRTVPGTPNLAPGPR